MALEMLYQFRCDAEDCGRITGALSRDAAQARANARDLGWDLGPRDHPRIAGRRENTDFCPQHKPQEG